MTAQVFLIGIVGGSASGKTSLAEALARRFAHCGAYVIPEDDYYIDATSIPGFDPDAFNFDEPAAKDHGLLAHHLASLKEGKSIETPLYDFTTHRRRQATALRTPAPVVLVEGLHLLASSAIARRLDLSVYVDAARDIRFARRLHRDVTERARTPQSVRYQFDGIVQPMHETHVEPQRRLADLVVENMGEPDFDGLAEPVVQRVPQHVRAK
jgi:uridine kinase